MPYWCYALKLSVFFKYFILMFCCICSDVMFRRSLVKFCFSPGLQNNGPHFELDVFLFPLIFVAQIQYTEVMCGKCTLACCYKIYAAVCLQYFVCSWITVKNFEIKSHRGSKIVWCKTSTVKCLMQHHFLAKGNFVYLGSAWNVNIMVCYSEFEVTGSRSRRCIVGIRQTAEWWKQSEGARHKTSLVSLLSSLDWR